MFLLLLQGVALSLIAIVVLLLLFITIMGAPPSSISHIPGPPLLVQLYMALIKRRPGIDGLIPLREYYGDVYKTFFGEGNLNMDTYT